jgi:hypothetical protein
VCGEFGSQFVVSGREYYRRRVIFDESRLMNQDLRRAWPRFNDKFGIARLFPYWAAHPRGAKCEMFLKAAVDSTAF